MKGFIGASGTNKNRAVGTMNILFCLCFILFLLGPVCLLMDQLIWFRDRACKNMVAS